MFESELIAALAGVNMPKEGKFKDMDTAQKEKARLLAKRKELKQVYNAQMANAYPGDPDETEDQIIAIDKELGMSKEDINTNDMKKVDEAIQMTADTPQEAGILMQILKLAGIEPKPVDDQMINKQDHEEATDEAYANTPDEKHQTTDDLVNTHSGGMNRQKQTFPKVAPGDNPMQRVAETTADLTETLRAQYESFKENYNKAKMAKDK